MQRGFCLTGRSRGCERVASGDVGDLGALRAFELALHVAGGTALQTVSHPVPHRFGKGVVECLVGERSTMAACLAAGSALGCRRTLREPQRLSRNQKQIQGTDYRAGVGK